MKESFYIKGEGNKMRKVCDGDVYLNSHGDKITVLRANWAPIPDGFIHLTMLDNPSSELDKPTKVCVNGEYKTVYLIGLGDSYFDDCELISER